MKHETGAFGLRFFYYNGDRVMHLKTTETVRNMTAGATVLGAAVIFVYAGATHAQTASQQDIQEQLLACDNITDLTRRLLCFDELVDAVKRDDAASETTPTAAPAPADIPAAAERAPPPAPDEPPAVQEAPVPVPADIADVPAAASSPPVAPVPDTPAPVPAAAVAGSAAAAPKPVPIVEPQQAEPPPAPAETATSNVDDFGRDSMPKKDEREQAAEDEPVTNLSATIVRAWRNHDGRFSVELNNGQVWRETQGTRVGMPKEGKSVEIFEGRFGGYRMRIEDIRRIAWVRRTN